MLMTDNQVMGGDSMLFLFAILFLFSMGGNGFGMNGRNANYATQDDLNFSRMENQVRSNADLTERKTDGLANGLCDLGFNLQGQINSVSREVLESRYLTEKAVSEASAKTTAEIQSLKDMYQQDKIASLQAQINNLTMQQAISNATCGVVKYPTSATYVANNPFLCGCGNNTSTI